METDGESESKPILGGRYLMETDKFEMMGMPFEGLSIVGYDNLTGEYTSFWADTMSTWWVTATGKRVDEHRTEMTGTMRDIAGARQYRMVSIEKGPDEYDAEMYDTIPGQGEVLVMSFTAKRKK
jgi:hypothetical protein